MPITKRLPPLVAIPTTAGTGSEVTLWAVITDHDRQIKFNVGGTPLIGAHAAVIDPELMLGLPPAVTAATGLDALSHGIECYTCDYHQPFNDAVALHAIELVGSWLRAAVEDGSNLEARTHMAHAATLGGMSYGTESAGAAHAMSQSAGGVHDCPHGALTARVLGPVCEFNVPAAPERYARIALGLGVDTAGMDISQAAYAGVEALERLIDDVGIPTMVELGFSEDEIPLLAQIAFDDPQTLGNPRVLDRRRLRRHLHQGVSGGGDADERDHARLRDGDRRRVDGVGRAARGDEPRRAASRSARCRRERARTRSARSRPRTAPGATGRAARPSSAPRRWSALPT